jgi:hypothetical protein
VTYLDPLTNQLITEHWDWKTKTLLIHKQEDVTSLMEELAHERGMGNKGWSRGRNWRKIGTIPNLEIERVLREEGINMMLTTPEAKKRRDRYFQENAKLTTTW